MSGLALGLFALPAAAQTAPSETGVAEVVVTGSRIPSPNLQSVSPVATVSGESFKSIGAADVVDVFNQLPQAGLGANDTPNPLSGAGGYTTVNLRNLGARRTLVLQDGKRLMPGDPGAEAPDLDTIPTFLIDRVDVVTGGASAVYGSDAVAGVVNFIMKKNFEGVKLDVQGGENWHDNHNTSLQNAEKAFLVPAPSGTEWDGQTKTISIAVGLNSKDDKGNIVGYITYRHADPVSQSSRDFSACQLAQTAGAVTCSGSSVGNFFDVAATGKIYSVAGASGSNIFTTNRTQLLTPQASFNSPPYNYLSRGDERFLGGFFAHYDYAPWAEIYSDFSAMDDRTQLNISPSGLFQTSYQVNCANPFLSAQQVSIICPTGSPAAASGQAALLIGRRNIEAGARIGRDEHESYKYDLGVRGDIADGWRYDAYAQLGRANINSQELNDESVSRIQNALLVGGTAANPVCLSGGACVPYNIFADGGVSKAALNYISAFGTSTGFTQEQIVSANITGQLGQYGVKSPFATDGVAVNFGVEYRREQLSVTPDQESISGDLAGSGGAAPGVTGAFDVKEGFIEARVPLVQDMPWVKDLTFETSVRYSDYSTAGASTPYKVGFEWVATPDLMLRASYQKAVRAPDVQELFSPQRIGVSSVVSVDPCAPTQSGNNFVAATATLAQCMRTGVTAAQYGNGISPQAGGTDLILQCAAFQCGNVSGGNQLLKPETSKTYSFGFVLTPHELVRGFNLSVDYFNIDVEGAISTVPVNLVLNSCLTSDQQCNLIVRTANGSLFGGTLAGGGYIAGVQSNIGLLKTSGVDVLANYRFGLDDVGLQGLGDVALTFNGTWTDHLINEPFPGKGSYDCAGLYGATCGSPTPAWRHQARVTWQSPWKVDVSLQWRFIGSTALDSNTSNPLLTNNLHNVLDGNISSYSYIDLTGSWAVRPGLKLRAGINNLFDKDPPTISASITSTGGANTFGNYDLLGRTLFFGLSADF
jgi:iron complex outermembrane receptor protein